MCCSEQRFHLRNGWKNKKEEKKGRVFGAEQSLIPLTQKLTLIPETQHRASPQHPLGQAANNTHNAACLWLSESPVAILVQLVEDCARDVMPGSCLQCRLIDANSWHACYSYSLIRLALWTVHGVFVPSLHIQHMAAGLLEQNVFQVYTVHKRLHQHTDPRLFLHALWQNGIV